MSIEHLLFDSLTPQYHQNYVDARKNAGMDYIENFDEWLSKTGELETLKSQNQNDTWENSEHNPANYPDFDSLDDETKQLRITQGNAEYWIASERLENKIRVLEALLIHPDEMELISDDDSEEPVEYYTIDD
ncbi:hypothetical protein LP087_13715 (plasmid) [Moraxella bovis]|uniref:hypothetical protein n=1 Tax=Moraxella bovis TaxID=476 RepID=UPI002225F03B|nr:hypothetical protein [Moraxella bovis]UZA34024.1 hypothetical protein LP087_13715 [Moraxella bovis]UZA49969.1 hypothetical protein LP100_14115 [Moraxella bovis]